MGGLHKYTPVTMWTLAAATLAISGVPFLSGAASKDLILEAAYEHSPWMFWVGTFTAGMTAFYVTRAFVLTFFGEYKGDTGHGHGDDQGHGDHGHGGKPHEAPWVMLGPLVVLAALSLGGHYLFNVPEILEPMFEPHEGEVPGWMHPLLMVVGPASMLLAYFMYAVSPGTPKAIASSLGGVYNAIYNKYFIDEFYDSTVIRPVIDGSRQLLWRMADVRGIDGIANGIGSAARGLGGVLKLAQSGYIRNYAAWVLAGTVIVVLWVGFAGMGAAE